MVLKLMRLSRATFDTAGQSVTLVYVDGTRGLATFSGSASDLTGIAFVAATGGTSTEILKFILLPVQDVFKLQLGGNAIGCDTVSYMVVAGGGGSGKILRWWWRGGGGFRVVNATCDPYTASPLDAGAGLPVSVQVYPIAVGGGSTGSGSPLYSTGDGGSASVFCTITSAEVVVADVVMLHNTLQMLVVQVVAVINLVVVLHMERKFEVGNTPPVSPPQGTCVRIVLAPGWAGSGGGAPASGVIRVGGVGATSSITGCPVGCAGGGGGGPAAGTPGGPQPGGGGGCPCGSGANYDTNAGANTGGGGGSDGGSGGSGVVVIRYKFQYLK